MNKKQTIGFAMLLVGAIGSLALNQVQLYLYSDLINELQKKNEKIKSYSKMQDYLIEKMPEDVKRSVLDDILTNAEFRNIMKEENLD
ncbi:MAG TPA: hypothetical protein PKW49_00905 [Paludibacteraceae bacterium]|nr:hypothetical protein [Paludibacteraceae bacterium]